MVLSVGLMKEDMCVTHRLDNGVTHLAALTAHMYARVYSRQRDTLSLLCRPEGLHFSGRLSPDPALLQKAESGKVSEKEKRAIEGGRAV